MNPVLCYKCYLIKYDDHDMVKDEGDLDHCGGQVQGTQQGPRGARRAFLFDRQRLEASANS